MSNWENRKGVALQPLEDARKALHQAVQLVGAVPRRLLPVDPTDVTASLPWNSERKAFQSISVPEDGDVQVGLNIADFELFVVKGSQKEAGLSLVGKSVLEALDWLKTSLGNLGLDSGALNLELPYAIDTYDYSLPLQAKAEALEEYALLYDHIYQELVRIKETSPKTYDIRCWPHHFDLATLIPLATNDKGEVTQSTGIGLSPGDEGIPEPYVYVNIWPNVELSGLREACIAFGPLE